MRVKSVDISGRRFLCTGELYRLHEYHVTFLTFFCFYWVAGFDSSSKNAITLNTWESKTVGLLVRYVEELMDLLFNKVHRSLRVLSSTHCFHSDMMPAQAASHLLQMSTCHDSRLNMLDHTAVLPNQRLFRTSHCLSVLGGCNGKRADRKVRVTSGWWSQLSVDIIVLSCSSV